MDIQTEFICPSCIIALSAETLTCLDCGQNYPRLNGVPFLFPNPELERARWEARAHHELQDIRRQQNRTQRELRELGSDSGVSKHTRERLKRLSTAFNDHLECITTLLNPLLEDRHGSDQPTYNALETGLLRDSTTLFSYTANLFRDWVWGDAENKQAMNMIASVGSGDMGRTLVLGAGGGRLTWDIAKGAATEVVAVDINPFTTLAAAQITRRASPTEEPLRLWEFPLSPITLDDIAIERALGAPEAEYGDNLQFVLADARALPLAPQTFDTVITPWFTDVVQQSPTDTARLINRLLKDQGRWLNFGSVAFANSSPSKTLLLDELCATVSTQGFSMPKTVEERGPYLCSPHSRYGRTELLHAFCATKTAPAQALKKKPAKVSWLDNPTQPVPLLPDFEEQAMTTQVHAFLMSLIDGQRSVIGIAQVLEQQKLMTEREAIPVIQGFLRKMMDDT